MKSTVLLFQVIAVLTFSLVLAGSPATPGKDRAINNFHPAGSPTTSNAPKPLFKALAVASTASDHLKMIACARPALQRIARENNIVIDVTTDTSQINDTNLKNYQVFIQLHEAPFDMSYAQQAALQKFILDGKGWVGIHAAGLTGKNFLNPGMTYWSWFEEFIGGVEYSPHPKFQKGSVKVEDQSHPAMKNIPASFSIGDEWYEFNKSPRDQVRVLAVADESSYTQRKPMGDHPIIWTNEKYRRMIYIGIGHDSTMCSDKNFLTIVANSVLWAGEK